MNCRFAFYFQRHIPIANVTKVRNCGYLSALKVWLDPKGMPTRDGIQCNYRRPFILPRTVPQARRRLPHAFMLHSLLTLNSVIKRIGSIIL